MKPHRRIVEVPDSEPQVADVVRLGGLMDTPRLNLKVPRRLERAIQLISRETIPVQPVWARAEPRAGVAAKVPVASTEAQRPVVRDQAAAGRSIATRSEHGA